MQTSPQRASISPNLAAALSYAQIGLQVFPCHVPLIKPHRVGFGSDAMIYCSCAHASCAQTKAGKHPATQNGFLSATTDAATIKRLWQANEALNVAIRTGDGLVVIDIDKRNSGHKTLAALERKHTKLSDKAKALTGGGWHLYFKHDKAVILSGARNLLGEGIDVKASDAYVVAPPSLHYSGKRYKWASGKIPTALPIAPKWLLKLISERSARASDERCAASTIKTSEHPQGLAIAKVIGAIDRKTYWKFDCPSGRHSTPDCSMFPRERGEVFFKCWSKNECSEVQIARALKARFGI